MTYGEGTQFGGFRLLRLLGAGGAGEVHLATDEESGRAVALKILAEDAAADLDIRASFEKEARLSLDLVHPNLVRCLRADVTARRPWIAFEYVEGNSLADVLEAQGILDPWLAADVILDVALGLAAAHQKGVLHQDIKPHNVLLTGDGTIKLIDFGAASADRLPDEDFDPAFDVDLDSLDDEGGVVAFSLHYASPEQLQGREVDPSSDLYSLGLVFYELLTGGKPHRRRLEDGRDHGAHEAPGWLLGAPRRAIPWWRAAWTSSSSPSSSSIANPVTSRTQSS